MEIIIESTFGKRFPIKIIKNGISTTYTSIASANAKPGERPYRITWFIPDYTDNRHVDLTLEEMMGILERKYFPPEIVQRVRDRYPQDTTELIGDEYDLMF